MATASVTSLDRRQTRTETQALTAPVEFSLRGQIRERLDVMEDPDVGGLAEELVESVPEHLLREALRQLQPSIRRIALEIANETRRDRERLKEESARWGVVKHAHQSGALSIYRWLICFEDKRPSKFFGDCDVKDLAEVVAGYNQRAVAMADQGQRFGIVLRELKKRKAATVQEIPVERLVEIFNA